MKHLDVETYQILLTRMTTGTYPNRDKWWRLDLAGLSQDLASIRIDFIESPWNAAQRFWGYLCDFNISERLVESCPQQSK